MIIDTILDRRDGCAYSRDDMSYMHEEAETFGLVDLARALDSGSDDDIRRELCRYIDDGGYRQDVKKYVNSVDWIAA